LPTTRFGTPTPPKEGAQLDPKALTRDDRPVAIAVHPTDPDDPDRLLTRIALVALGIVIGLFVYAMFDAYVL
jgi:hypothetical protein